MNRFLFLAVLMGLSYQAHAQSISGRVIDSESLPIVGANCVINVLSDSSFVRGVISNNDGRFELEVKEDCKYILTISYMGYKKVSRVCEQGEQGNIVLEADVHELGSILVLGEQRRQDARIETFYLTDSLRNSATNILGLLSKLDGITKDLMSDEIKIGEYKDVPLMLNGRDVGKNIVKNLNPKRVQKVELLRFPKGRYGDAPIVINIVTYDNFSGYDLGVQSNGMLSLRSPHPHSENVGASLTYSTRKWNVYADLGIKNQDTWEAASYSYTYNDVSKETAEEDYCHPNNKISRQKGDVSLGTDYRITDGHSVSVQTWLEGANSSEAEHYTTTDRLLLSDQNNSYRNINSTTGIYYKGKIGDAFKLSSDFVYNYYRVRESRTYQEPNSLFELHYIGRKDFYIYNIDLSKTWSKTLGANLGYTFTDKSYTNTDTGSNDKLFYSSEKRHNVYASMMFSPSARLSFSIGGNVLYVDRTNNAQSDAHTSWMPLVKFFWQPHSKLRILGNYYCDVEYPSLDLLSDIAYRRNSVLWHRGNPNLKERVMHYMQWRIKVPEVVEVIYLFKHSTNDITSWYSFEKSDVVETLVGSKYLHQYIGANNSFCIGKKLMIELTANYQWYQRKVGETIWRHGRTWYLDLNATYPLTSNTMLLGGYFLRYDKMPLLQGEEYGQEERLMLGTSTSLCQHKLSLMVVCAIPTSLISKCTYQKISIPQYHFIRQQDARVDNALLRISLRYNISKGEVSKSSNANKSESEK
ncbi:MAG: carboxypeptidase-like regulatory domain-containing protein [Prevotella sp.]|nr:carboxypeptidase-like regulatory domain-containing protein [Prevotella sp.]